DFIVGSSVADPGARSDACSARVYSGSDGSLHYRKDGAHTGDYLGFDVAGVGDVNGDGYADFLIGAYAANPGGVGNAGSAYLYSGADGSLLFQKDGEAANDFLGNSVAGVGDVNRDGTPDFIIGASEAEPGGLFNAGSAYVYSGADGSLLLKLNGAAANDQLGISVDGAGDLNGDGRTEIIVGAWRADPGGIMDAGSAFVLSLRARGDMNNDLELTPADVVLTLTCVFLQSGSCDLATYDLDCDGQLSPADAVLELNGVFLAAALPPC
ncbi:MAG TPA: integrin alpha, partial [candidate division Zixibacteria bacterium]|nr:integrin alpha [candidate division Zixibacteria bacterium]